MPDLETTPQRRGPGAPDRAGSADRRPSVALAALTAAGWAAAVGLVSVTVIVLLAWVTDPRSTTSTGAALRLAAQIWLLAQGVPIRLSYGTYALVPLGLTVLAGWLLARAGTSLARSTAVTSRRRAGSAVGALAAAYALCCVAVGGLASVADDRLSPVRVFLATGLLAAVAGGIGVLRGTDLDLWAGIPPRLRWLAPALRGGTVATTLVLAVGALLAAAAVLGHAGTVREVYGALQPGAVGGFALLLASLAYAPNGVAWAAAYVVGPGFALGTGTVVRPPHVRLGPVPAMPLLAAVPGQPLGAVGWALLAVPIGGGVLAGIVVGRLAEVAAAPVAADRRWLVLAAASGLTSGLLLGLAALLSGGPAGASRLAAVGPSPWQVAAWSALEVTPSAILAAWWVVRRRRSRPGLPP